MDDFVIIYVTAATQEEASMLAATLVKEKLAACANVVPAIQSFYNWQEEFCEDNEVLLILKTRKDLQHLLVKRVKSLHSYEVPEIISVPIIGGYEKYLHWLVNQTGRVQDFQ